MSAEGGPAFVADEANLGTDPQAWAGWEREFALLDATGHDRLVVLAPHPDDEVLGAGGLMADFAATGREVLVVAVTDGEAAVAPVPGMDAHGLGALRTRESVDACADLGVGAPLRLGLPDGAVAQHEAALASTLQRLLRPADLVVCTLWNDGHPDHEALARAAVQAVAQAIDEAAAPAASRAAPRLLHFPVWMWHWSWPEDPRLPWERALQWPLSDRTRSLKARAVQRFRSQVEAPAVGDAVLSATTLQRCLQRRELYFEG